VTAVCMCKLVLYCFVSSRHNFTAFLANNIASCIDCRIWQDGCIHGSNSESDMCQRKGDNVSEFGMVQVFTARCYASTVLAMGLCLSVCPSVCHKSVFYRNS